MRTMNKLRAGSIIPHRQRIEREGRMWKDAAGGEGVVSSVVYGCGGCSSSSNGVCMFVCVMFQLLFGLVLTFSME